MVDSLPTLVDTHCHLDFESFNPDRANVVETARQLGIKFIVNPSVDLPSSMRVVEMAESIPEIYAAVGVHPNDADTWSEHTIEYFRKLAQHSKVVAIGEIGLDYYWKKTPADLQKKILLEQLSLAESLDLPVIIHNRDASDDILALLCEWQEGLVNSGSSLAICPGVLHSFSGNGIHAVRAIKHNYLIGITGPVTFKNAKGLQHLVASLPLEHILIETDSPFLSPHPFRGQRNEPGRVLLVAQKIADLHGCSLDDVANITTANARRLFHWREAL